MDKTRAAVKDLYARILIAIRSAESISKRIQKLRDEELQPQIVELLKGYESQQIEQARIEQLGFLFGFPDVISYSLVQLNTDVENYVGSTRNPE